MTVTRPLLRWHGGKWRQAPAIVALFPPHRVYVEPFGGAASVLLRKPRAYAEYYGDLDDDLVNLFAVLRSDAACTLIQQIRLTPYARAEVKLGYQPTDDCVEQARRLIVRSFMGFGSPGAMGRSTGFRDTSNRSGTTPAQDWRNLPEAMPAIVDRLRGVVVERRAAMELMGKHDGPDTLHYVDPPYLAETRGRGNPYCTKHKYRHELSDDDHRDLLAFLSDLQGMVVLSGYPSEIYEAALPSWHRIDKLAFADGARPRTEVLWLNPACAGRRAAPSLFEAA
jgi:DNA adenine methylase